MRNVMMAVSLMTALGSTIVSAQTPPNTSSDSVRTPTADSVQAFAPQFEVAPHEGRWICRNKSHWQCVLYGAGTLAAIGYIVGDALSPQPKYEKLGLLDGGSILGGETCVANCGVPGKAIVFTLSGAALGSFAGWILGRD